MQNTLLNIFIVLSTVLAIFMSLIWKTSDSLNTFLKFIYVLLSILGCIVCIKHFGIL